MISAEDFSRTTGTNTYVPCLRRNASRLILQHGRIDSSSYLFNVSLSTVFHLSSHYHFLLVGILLKRTNEAARRSIVTLAVTLLIELFENLLGQHLAQLDTPLVEAVDIPDRSLSEGQVLVVDNQST